MQNRSLLYTFSSLFLVLIVDTIGFALIMPILAPLYLDPTTGILPATLSLPIKNFYYGLTMATFFIFTFLGAPFMGTLSDQIGRRKVLIICLLGVGLGFLISAFGVIFKSVFLIILGRAVGGFSAGSQPIAQTAIIDISTEENKTKNIAFITLAGCIGFIIGPILGGSLSGLFLKNHMGFAVPFFFSTVLAVLNAIAVNYTFKETFVPKPDTKVRYLDAIFGLKKAFSIKAARILLIINFIYQMAWGLYYQFITLYLVHVYHVSTMTLGYFMAYTGVVYFITLTWVIKFLLKNFSIQNIALGALILMTIGLIINLFDYAIWVPWLAAGVICVGAGLIYTTIIALTSNCVDRESQGMIIGSVGSLMSLGWVVAGLSMGALTKLSLHTPFVVMILLCIISAAMLFLNNMKVLKQKRAKEA